ncbi:MAG: formate dehydrogenase family accessory protein FdhD [Chloroflexi bacterium RBG_16_50_9]|nr:MAG: formate dehydrogenase family accessory protein FdhD [Chloroflexi bacterium RBG_16_50_9]
MTDIERAGEAERFSILRLSRESKDGIEKMVARERPFTIILNDNELVTLLSSPVELKYLAVGFLYSEGLIQSRDDIKKVTVDDQRGVARVETVNPTEIEEGVVFKRIISSGCGRGASFYSAADTVIEKVDSSMELSVDEVFILVAQFQRRSELYAATGAVHSAALCDHKDILIFSEDIGRHNAIDKIFGRCLLDNIPAKNRIIVTSGRITSEIMHKVAKRGIPVLISVSAPTDLAVKTADVLGITLVASVRGKKMDIYTGNERIVTDGTSGQRAVG